MQTSSYEVIASMTCFLKSVLLKEGSVFEI